MADAFGQPDQMARKTGFPAESPEAKAKRALESLSKAEQQRSDSARAWAEYIAESEAQDANTTRLRTLRLAKEAADRLANEQVASRDKASKAQLAEDGAPPAVRSAKRKARAKTAGNSPRRKP